MITLAGEHPEHADHIETLLDIAFGTNRQHKTSYRYRENVAPVSDLSRTAWVTDPLPGAAVLVDRANALVGSIRYWPVLVGEAPVLLLGPLAVCPHHQGRQIGAALMEDSLDRAATLGHALVLLVGDIGYYHRFGFHTAALAGISMPGEQPERLLVRELAPGALRAVAGPVSKWAPTPPARNPAHDPVTAAFETLPPAVAAG